MRKTYRANQSFIATTYDYTINSEWFFKKCCLNKNEERGKEFLQHQDLYILTIPVLTNNSDR